MLGGGGGACGVVEVDWYPPEGGPLPAPTAGSFKRGPGRGVSVRYPLEGGVPWHRHRL